MTLLTRPAVLVVDIQNDFVHPSGLVGNAVGDVSGLLAAVESINRLIATARKADVPVVYIRVTHSPELDNPAYRARYASRGMTKDDLLCADGSWGADFFDGLTLPSPSDLSLVKHGYGAFASGELSAYLRHKSVETVVVTGVVTELCVLATVSGGFESGFHTVVPRETTSSIDPEAALAALALISGFYGDVVSLDDVLFELESHDAKVDKV